MIALFRRKPALRPPRERLAALLAAPRVPPGLAAALTRATDATAGACTPRGVESAAAAAVLDALAPAVAWAGRGSWHAGDAVDEDAGAAQRKVAGAIIGDAFNEDEAALLVFGAAAGEGDKVDRRVFGAICAACGVDVAPPWWWWRVGWGVARVWMRSGGRAVLERVVQAGKEARGEWEGRGRLEASVEYCDLDFERIVGEGAFAEVWKGKWMATEVAIKRFHGDISLLSGTKRVHGTNLEHRRDAVADLFRRREDRRCLPGGDGKTSDEEASDILLQYASRILSDDADGGGQVHRNVTHTELNRFLSGLNRDKYKSFLAEVAALNKLRHQNIVKYVPCRGFHCPVLFRNYVLQPCF